MPSVRFASLADLSAFFGALDERVPNSRHADALPHALRHATVVDVKRMVDNLSAQHTHASPFMTDVCKHAWRNLLHNTLHSANYHIRDAAPPSPCTQSRSFLMRAIRSCVHDLRLFFLGGCRMRDCVPVSVDGMARLRNDVVDMKRCLESMQNESLPKVNRAAASTSSSEARSVGPGLHPVRAGVRNVVLDTGVHITDTDHKASVQERNSDSGEEVISPLGLSGMRDVDETMAFLGLISHPVVNHFFPQSGYFITIAAMDHNITRQLSTLVSPTGTDPVSRNNIQNSVNTDCSSQYVRFGVLPRQARARHSLVEKIRNSLPSKHVGAFLTDRDGEDDEILFGLQDFILLVCVHHESERRNYATCHRRLLRKFQPCIGLELDPFERIETSARYFRDYLPMPNFLFPSRKIGDPDDNDSFVNHSQYFVGPKRTAQLGVLVTSGEWSRSWLVVGGLAAISAESDHPSDCLKKLDPKCAWPVNIAIRDILLTRNAVRALWSSVVLNRLALVSPVSGRLMEIPEAGICIERYIFTMKKLDQEPILHLLDGQLPTENLEFVIPLPIEADVCAVNWEHQKAVIAGYTSIIWVNLKDGTIETSRSQDRDDFTSIAYSSDTAFVVSGSKSGKLQMWESATKSYGWTIAESGSWVLNLCISPDNRMLGTSHGGGKIRLWEISSGALCAELRIGKTENFIRFSPNGEFLWSMDDEGSSQQWNLATREVCGSPLVTNDYICRAISPDGSKAVMGSRVIALQLWDLEKKVKIGPPMSGHSDTVVSADFSADGLYIVSGSMDGTVRVWNSTNSRAIGKALVGHEGAVCYVSFSPNGRVLSVSRDGTLRIWHVLGEDSIADQIRGHFPSVYDIACSMEGRLVASQYGDGMVRFLDVV